ncbi:hypothetical protein ACHAWU_007255 [Discostella pseudostelligera]|uniref:RNA polymerase II assembly factor Rtp1 C-terminal domain-containing protein n=1 Tax=Discostella pseudostelligera TaxID=259834 RepID=A0ABD3LX28_9STRA
MSPHQSSRVAYDPIECEKRSTEVLGAIRCFVDGLRSAPSLKSPLQPSTSTKEPGHGCIHDGGSLLAHLNSIGVVQLVNGLNDQQMQQQQQSGEPNTTDSPRGEMTYARLGSFLQNHNEADERKQILYNVVVPLLRHLEHCYAIMDELPPPSPSSPPLSSAITETSKRNKAPPPLGMLSLNDYTNVACLLEFTMSISLIPLLEHPTIYLPPLPQSSTGNNTNSFIDTHLHKIDTYSTIMIQRRHQTIPKSLAGRISKVILTWGTISTTYSYNALYEHLHQSDIVLNDTSNTLRQSYQFYRIFQAYNEMTTVAICVGRLVLLDRFRPMLLPRHLSDIYLTLLIAERLRWYLSKLDSHAPDNHSMLATLMDYEKRREKCNNESLQSLQTSLLFSPLPFPSSVISSLPKPSPPKKFVDCREAALAYRTLLSGGASMAIPGISSPTIPSWLRIRIGQNLTKLAQEDVRSVVEVFVASARGPGGSDDGNNSASMNDDVMTGAAARLARALCTEPMRMPNSTSAKCKSLQFEEQLCSQFVSFLVAEGQVPDNLIQSRSTVAMHLTLWATIGQLPIDTLWPCFFQKLVSGLIALEEANSQEPKSHQLTAFQSISAIAKWLSMIPSSLDMQTKKKVKTILFEPCITIQGHKTTILGQVVRLAASLARHDHDSLKSPLIEEVGEPNQKFSSIGKAVDAALVHMLAILCSIGGSNTQICKDQYTIIALELLKSLSSNELDKEGFCFDKLQVKQSEPYDMLYRRSADMNDGNDLSHLIGAIEDRVKCLVEAFTTLSQSRKDENIVENNSEASIEVLTRSLFRLALLLHYEGFTTHRPILNTILNTLELDNLQASEKFELKMAASITLATMTESCPPSSLLGSGSGNDDSESSVLELLGLIINSAADRLNVAGSTKDEEEDSGLFSTVSIVLSLLIALLELGAEKRSISDEAFFKAVLPSLRILSSGHNESEQSYSPELTRSVPELAEMASHAMALIVARGELETSEAEPPPLADDRMNTRIDAILYKLTQAERDLQSTQPPIRAKGVVTLRHVARSLESQDGIGQSDQNALITDMSKPTSTSVQALSAKEQLALISRTLARICLNALADPESYVYLASIQTLVAIGDACPSHIIPLVGTVIATGRLRITVATADATVESVELSLSPEQRIKATEALIFMIRRRGDGIFLYGSSLMNTMLFGPRQYEYKNGSGSTLQNDDHTAQQIQRQTHLYFTGETNVEDDDVDEKKLRLNTGGPIFSMEETDLLRAGAISVVCELVSTLNPITIASYSHTLVKLATDAMQLDTSRPVRRVAACLARDLYACVMRELTTPSGENIESTCSMAVAIVDANEDKLYNVLTRCVSSNELAKTDFVDPSTQCRSQEAIDIRQELEAMGVLRAAEVVLLEQSKYPEIIIQKLSLK